MVSFPEREQILFLSQGHWCVNCIPALQHFLQWSEGSGQWKQSSIWQVAIILTCLEGIVPQISAESKKVAGLPIIYLKENALQHGFKDMNYYFSLFIQCKIIKNNMFCFMYLKVKILCLTNYVSFKFCSFKKICTLQLVWGAGGRLAFTWWLVSSLFWKQLCEWSQIKLSIS